MRTPATLLLLVAALSLHGQSADAIQKRLETEAAALQTWTADKVLVDAIAAQNGQKLPLAEIQRRDKAWTSDAALVQSVTTGACADRLRQLAAKSRLYGEVLLMNNQGALVCATNRTSDYWQGDEPKWTRAFDGGAGATFIDRLRVDESAHERLAQISLPVKAAGKAIGAITVGVRLDRLTGN